MTLLLVACAVLVASGIAGGALSRRPALGLGIATWGAVVAAGPGLVAAGMVLARGPVFREWTSSLPGATFSMRIDSLSAWFLIPIFAVGSLAAVYGRRYLLLEHGHPVGGQALFFNLLLAAMVLVVTAADALLFLMAWEAMTLCAFLLVTYEHERAEVRSAGLLYLTLTHAGTACLLAMFAWLGLRAGSLRFDAMLAHAPFAPTSALGLFSLAGIGFGAKAGIWPLHVWLPAAHPVAPSHVSAVLSGILLKTAIYGLMRTLLILGPLPGVCGIVLILAGISSGVLGVLGALGQHELKRLLAYHSIENIGIILLGLGAGVLGVSFHHPALAAAGFAGALLHVTNHAIFKSLLFLGAGAVLRAVHHLQLDRLGGLLRRMPVTGAAFIVGAAAISGLPPLNGFVSEILVFLSLFKAGRQLPLAPAAIAVLAVASLALIGGLAAACFAKACGVVFLGSPREEVPATAGDPPQEMLIPMVSLAVWCAAIGLGAALVLPVLAKPAAQLAGAPLPGDLAPTVGMVSAVGGLFVLLTGGLMVLRSGLLRGQATAGPTWGCGYVSPGPTMQYTGASFAAPLIRVFAPVLWPERHGHEPTQTFTPPFAYEEHASDLAERFVYQPLLAAGRFALAQPRRLQTQRVQVYVLALSVVLVILLWWKVV